MIRRALPSRQQAAPRNRSALRRASPATLLDRPGVHQLQPEPARAGQANPRSVYCDLTVDREWASLTVGSSRLPSEPDPLSDLVSAGFEQPQPDGASPSVRKWFRSWAFTTPSARAGAAREILDAARLAFRVEPDAPIDIAPSAALADPDPAGPIVALLIGVYSAYCLVTGWVILFAWDALLPARAHPAAAIWAQLVAPAIALAATLAYAIVVPALRRRWAVRTRPPTAGEVDGSMPGVTPIGFIGAPVALILLLLITS